MADNKKRLKGSNSRKIRFNYKQGDPNWRKFNAQKLRFAISNNIKFRYNYKSPFSHRMFFNSIKLLCYFVLLALIFLIWLFKNVIDVSISEEKLFGIISAVIIISGIAIFEFVVIYQDRKQNGDLSRIRKYKPNTGIKKPKRKQKKQKEDIPWEL